MQNIATIFHDILNSFESGDTLLALKRMMDKAKDTGNSKLIQNSIDLSAFYKNEMSRNEYFANQNKEPFTTLLKEIEQFACDIQHIAGDLLLQVDSIDKNYKGFSLHNISFEIKRSEVIGVVGANGNGKTTLLQCISGDNAIDGGAIHYYFLDSFSYYNVKNKIAYIPQRIPRWYGSLKDNLCFSATGIGIFGEQNILDVNFILERMDLASYANHTWEELSSGYRTRFEIARVLLKRPSVLILDEPLANLDILAQQTLLSDLKFICQSIANPIGIVLSSQQLYEVEKIADKIILLKHGKEVSIQQNADDYTCVIEIETKTEKHILETILQNKQVNISYDGNYYTLSSKQLDTKSLIDYLSQQGIDINYYRNITHSTKRYF